MDKTHKFLNTNLALWRLFRFLDRTYFENRLESRVVDTVFASGSFMEEAMGRSRPLWTTSGQIQFKIYINAIYKGQRRVVYSTLLHEMLHCDKWWIPDCNGPVFDREMRRLCSKGAMKGMW